MSTDKPTPTPVRIRVWLYKDDIVQTTFQGAAEAVAAMFDDVVVVRHSGQVRGQQSWVISLRGEAAEAYHRRADSIGPWHERVMVIDGPKYDLHTV